ncbi:MAG: divalent-cation tolerance protein CutA [Bacteroidetes bacterium]|nr:divalent-cation tolerance protein CutA [Bacteroidota bacterium]
MPFKILYITSPTASEAERIARYLVDHKLAACVNILPGMQSYYSWQGATTHAEEVLMLCKTLSQNIPAIVDVVKKLHSHEIPAISAIPIFGGNPEYLAWLAQESPGLDYSENAVNDADKSARKN